MSARIPFAAFAVLLTAISVEGTASARTYVPYGAGQNVDPFLSRIPSDARASQASQNSTRPYITQQQNETWKRTYPEYPFQNGGGG
jgi:hypothetical protein